MKNVKYVSVKDFIFQLMQFDDYAILRHPHYKHMYYVSMWVDGVRWVLSVDISLSNESPELATMLFDYYPNALAFVEKMADKYKRGL